MSTIREGLCLWSCCWGPHGPVWIAAARFGLGWTIMVRQLVIYSELSRLAIRHAPQPYCIARPMYMPYGYISPAVPLLDEAYHATVIQFLFHSCAVSSQNHGVAHRSCPQYWLPSWGTTRLYRLDRITLPTSILGMGRMAMYCFEDELLYPLRSQRQVNGCSKFLPCGGPLRPEWQCGPLDHQRRHPGREWSPPYPHGSQLVRLQ